MDEEPDLLRRARALDESALTEIHNRYYPDIFRYLSFRLPDNQTAEDLTSEVFLRFLHSIREKSSPPNTIKGWLFGAARNVTREHYRRSKKLELAALSEQLPSDGPTLESSFLRRMETQALKKALDNLTEDQRHVLALRFGFGLPIREVAKLINKSEPAVKMLQARAIMALTLQMDSVE